jgi:gamma-glutamyl phosphate reductase
MWHVYIDAMGDFNISFAMQIEACSKYVTMVGCIETLIKKKIDILI